MEGTMSNVTNYHAPIKVTSEINVGGKPTVITFEGDVTPANEAEAALLADLAALGVVKVATAEDPKPRPRKNDKPDEENI